MEAFNEVSTNISAVQQAKNAFNMKSQGSAGIEGGRTNRQGTVFNGICELSGSDHGTEEYVGGGIAEYDSEE